MNSHIFEDISEVGEDEMEKEYACLIRFYTDPEVNFYEKDRNPGY